MNLRIRTPFYIFFLNRDYVAAHYTCSATMSLAVHLSLIWAAHTLMLVQFLLVHFFTSTVVNKGLYQRLETRKNDYDDTFPDLMFDHAT